MAQQPIRIPNLQQRNPIVDDQGRMTDEFARRLNDVLKNIVTLLNAIAALPDIQAALVQLDTATAAAQAAATAAQAAADQASSATAATQRESSLQGSYISPESVVAATSTDIIISNHTRFYPQASGAPVSVAVNGDTVGAPSPGATAYVSYIDVNRTGGAVTYIVTTTPPTQTGDTHVVGAVVIPETGTVDGGEGPTRPGYVRPQQNQLPQEP